MDKVDLISSICLKIYNMAKNMKANKERCQQVAQKVKALQELVLTIKQSEPGQISASVYNALQDLCTSLEGAKEIMMKFSKTKAVMSFLKSSSHQDMFYKVDKILTDNFQVLSVALQIEQGKIMHEMYDTISGRRHTTLMPRPSILPSIPTSTPTAPTPVSCIMSPMPTSTPTAPTPVSCIMSPMPTSTPTAPTPVSCIMSPMPTSTPTAPMPFSSIMSPMRAYSPMLLYRNIAPTCFSTTIISNSATVSPIVISSATAPNASISINAPMTFSTQNTSFATSYVVNSSYYA